MYRKRDVITPLYYVEDARERQFDRENRDVDVRWQATGGTIL